MVKSMSSWEKSGTISLLVAEAGRASTSASVVACLVAGSLSLSLPQAIASPLDAAATASPAAAQSSALQHAADHGPLTSRYTRYENPYYHAPYFYAGDLTAAWDANDTYASPDYPPYAPQAFAPARGWHQPQLTCFRPRLIVLSRHGKKHNLPRVTYGGSLPCGYRG
jgi:hypothetical protein